MKQLIKRLLPIKLRKFLEKLLHGESFDEVSLIYHFFNKLNVRDGLMIDVGAHHGHSLEPFALRGWKVYAFEPDSVNRAILVTNWGLKRNVIISEKAVGDKELENVPFYTSNVSSGISSVLKFHESHQESEKIKMTTLSKLISENDIQSLNFLKVDTEGHDLFVLKGLDWNAIKPACILSEFDDFKTKQVNYSLSEMYAFLEAQGYKILISEWHPITEYGKKHAWRRFITDPRMVTATRAWGNLIAVIPELWPQFQDFLQNKGFEVKLIS